VVKELITDSSHNKTNVNLELGHLLFGGRESLVQRKQYHPWSPTAEEEEVEAWMMMHQIR
jgi:hypothetical protein